MKTKNRVRPQIIAAAVPTQTETPAPKEQGIEQHNGNQTAAHAEPRTVRTNLNALMQKGGK